MIRTDVLVVGGGLAGLSAAYHLDRLGGGRIARLVVEKESRPGGLAGSLSTGGFTFDHTGHLLHLHDPYGKRLILGLLKGNVLLHRRSSWIHSHGTQTRYPFQANTFGLPAAVVEDCVAGFLKTAHRPLPVPPGLSFEEWSRRVFGEGICRHFMFPYNRKLWRADLSRMTTEWQGRFIPKPATEEVLYGALTDQKKFFGYNAAFRYPLRGGAQALPDALAARVPGLKLGCAVARVDLREKTAEVEGLGEVRYERLVNTMPLARFLDVAGPLPGPAAAARAKLRWRTVYNLNIGVARPRVSDKHWIYFPEPRFAFYRVGFPSNFSPRLTPKGTSSLYIEVSRRPEERVDLPRLERRILDDLEACGILKGSDRVVAKLWIRIPCAYVLYDFDRTPAVRALLPFLRERGVESIGRFGAWKYSFMEEAILDGKRCAERLLGLAPEPAFPGPEAELKPLK